MTIKTKANAQTVAELFVSESPEIKRWYCIGYDADKPFIQLWNEPDWNRLMIFIEQNDDDYKIAVIDTVNGTEGFRCVTLSEIAEAIWINRKFINQSGQIASL